MSTKTKEPTTEQLEMRARLREMYPPGAPVVTTLNHVSQSGMTRAISVVTCGGGGPEDVSWMLPRAFPEHFQFDNRWGGIKRGGCGMDMGFDLAYSLASALYPQGFECIGQSEQPRRYCPSNDHSNGDRDYQPHHHRSGGYALPHRWL